MMIDEYDYDYIPAVIFWHKEPIAMCNELRTFASIYLHTQSRFHVHHVYVESDHYGCNFMVKNMFDYGVHISVSIEHLKPLTITH